MNGYSYSDLAFHVADSDSNRRFCGFSCPEEVPRKSALARNIKRISAETWEKINRILLEYAKDKGIEGGKRVRIDPTVTETNIHAPTDNKLLFDCVRVLGRLLKQGRKTFGVAYASRIKRAKRRAHGGDECSEQPEAACALQGFIEGHERDDPICRTRREASKGRNWARGAPLGR